MKRHRTNRGPGSIRGDVRDRAQAIVADLRETFSIGELAEALDVSKATIHRWEHGESRPVRRLAQEIVGGEGGLRDRLTHNRAQKGD